MVLYIELYVYVFIAFWLITALTAGYHGLNQSKEDFISSLIWPVTLATILGTLLRVFVEFFKEKTKN